MKPSQDDLLGWVVDVFGAKIASDRDERARRLVEEAIELGQAVSIDRATVGRIADRVYSRPPGAVEQEIGGTAFTLFVLAEVLGFNAEDCLTLEYQRVRSTPRHIFTDKHVEKVEAGI
jgi:hypothetical protein